MMTFNATPVEIVFGWLPLAEHPLHNFPCALCDARTDAVCRRNRWVAFAEAQRRNAMWQ
jgi:hypothetical protein